MNTIKKTNITAQKPSARQLCFTTNKKQKLNGFLIKLSRVKEIFLVVTFLTASSWICQAQTIISPPNYTVVSPGFQYTVNGISSGQPAVSGTDDSLNFSLNAGATYIFSISASSIHPVVICTNANTTSRFTGASPQNIYSGNIALTIPASNYPPTLYYVCTIHSFYGIITINPPQPPPVASILSTAVTTNIVLTFSGGTNTISLVPQYSSNLFSGGWQNVPSYTNTFSGNGTNSTSFSRLDAICGPNVFMRISQAPN